MARVARARGYSIARARIIRWLGPGYSMARAIFFLWLG